ncbi:hypothetical protein ACFQ9Z_00505 [Streptomyces sp. NPDC056580]|uniref:hypothetical protein n=1 Tax=Streptomyces sp. NPDC056580 TaxID=3345872 RepID=UPI0036963C68
MGARTAPGVRAVGGAVGGDGGVADDIAGPDEPAADLHVLGGDPEDPHAVAFGHGPHFCLAALTARMEAEVMIRAVLGRFPRLRLAVADEDVEFQREGLIRGPRVLPVTW